MSWPLLLGGLLLSASPAMSGSIRPGYNMIPMSYPPNPLPYPSEMPVHPLRANRTLNRLSYPEQDPKLPHKRYSRRVQEEIRRRTEAMMRRDSPSMKKIRARIALLGIVSIIVLLYRFFEDDDVLCVYGSHTINSDSSSNLQTIQLLYFSSENSKMKPRPGDNKAESKD